MALKPDEWTKSSANGDNCVEVMRTADEVLVRNSKRPGEAPQRFTFDEWDFFTRSTKPSVFDLD